MHFCQFTVSYADKSDGLKVTVCTDWLCGCDVRPSVERVDLTAPVTAVGLSLR